ncbi:flagellar protein FlhE [Kushneria aurantia]|uniref:Flagellar protein FlhE n=1 Tax=Kushneria aurantia TaxID=504092 RepID=A0ABV6G104_9GAMM|nr:flagellar protein FlhE [Kushneria aurantia]
MRRRAGVDFPLWIAVGLIALAAGAPAQGAGGGAVVIDDSTPDLAQRERVYQVRLQHPTLEQLDGEITTLYWRIELAPSRELPIIELCVAGYCDQLEMRRGASNEFEGLPADSNIEFRFMVPGRGMLQRPIRGGSLQLIVNYRQQTAGQ